MSTQFQLECPALYGRSLAAAKRLQHSHIGVEHLVLALLREVASPLSGALSQIGIEADTLITSLEMEIGSGKSNSDMIVVTPRLEMILSVVGSEGALTPRTLVRGILIEGESLFVRLLISRGVAIQSLLATIDGVKARQVSDEDATRHVNNNIQSGKVANKLTPPKTHVQLQSAVGSRIQPKIAIPVTFPTPTLDGCGRDLRILAGQGRLKDACGREQEIEQMITILARTQKSNPILLGDAGVGKTAIVEALAWRIAEGLVPPILRGKRIVELQMGELMAGTQLRGQFEQRIQQVIKEATDAPDVILFIDEIHTLVGAGRSQGSANDAAQMLKPALARGDISCIGATTEDEFSRYIRKDPALERRFSPVIISELSPSATLRILDGIASNIVRKQAEGGFQILISPGALSAAVTLTDTYVKNRNQPDKSIDAIDIACARAVVQGQSTVNADDVALVISEWTGIPVGRLSANDRHRYAQIEATLEQRVIGQDAAIAAVSRSVRTSLAGMKAPNRPIGVFLFIGPSGVGKTKLAKELTSFLFGSESALIRFDMNEYQDKHTLTNLIGSARGYLGSDQGV